MTNPKLQAFIDKHMLPGFYIDVTGCYSIVIYKYLLNRYLKGYGNSITDICCARNQFAVGHTYTEKQLQAVWDAMSGYDALSGYSQSNQNSTEVVYFSTGCLRYGSYFCTIGGHVFRTYS